MPELHGECAVSRRWRLPALVTGITLVSGVALAGSTIDGRRHPVIESRRPRGGSAGRRRALDRRQVLAAVASGAVPTLWPVDGAVSSPFGWRQSPYGGAREWHPGIDIMAPYGTPVRATADGEVIFAGRARGYGALVILDHGGMSTRYAHLAATWVRAGQVILRGEPVGALGGTGRATAPHLHYEVRLGSEALDPQCLVTRVEPIGVGASLRRRDGAPLPPRDAARVTTRRAGIAG